jgi:hypothetical protein
VRQRRTGFGTTEIGRVRADTVTRLFRRHFLRAGSPPIKDTADASNIPQEK